MLVTPGIPIANPSLNQAWSVQQQQKDKGLVVVGGGVHSPDWVGK
jgi:hypothetical protein